jgi:hypothetical protein
MLLSGV